MRTNRGLHSNEEDELVTAHETSYGANHLSRAIISRNAAIEHAVPDSQEQNPTISTLFSVAGSEPQHLAKSVSSPKSDMMLHNVETLLPHDETQTAAEDQRKPLQTAAVGNAGSSRKVTHSMKHRRSARPKQIIVLSNTQESLVFPRSKRSHPKVYTSHSKTEVDWEEDLRPTDDEAVEERGESVGTRISSPEPQNANVARTKTGDKRKRKPKPQRASGKRKKAIKGNGTVSGEGSTASPQLPLTAYPSASCQRTQVEHDQKPSEGITGQREIIEISSRLSSPSASPRDETNAAEPVPSTVPKSRRLKPSARSNGPNHRGKNAHGPRSPRSNGRGKVVGKKLMAALRGGEIVSQPRPPTENTITSANILSFPNNSEQLNKPPQRMSLAQASLSKESTASYHGLTKATTDCILTQQDNTELTANEDVVTEQIASSQQIPKTAFQGPLQPGSQFNSQCSTGVEVCRDAVTGRHSMSEVHWGDANSSALTTLQATKQGQDGFLASQRSTESSEYNSDVSSECPNAATAGHLLNLHAKMNGTDHTPESQKPLLAETTTMKTNDSCLKAPRTVPRNSIVDYNGSPRLAFPPHLEADRAHSEIDTSSSEYNGSPDGSSPRKSTESDLMWTKFQRDMFLEYGIDTQDMKHNEPRPWHKNPEHEAPLSSNSTSTGKTTSAVGLNHEKTSVAAPVSSQRTIEGKHAEPEEMPAPEVSTMASTEVPAPDRPQLGPRYSSSGEISDPLEWITTLQAAQKNAHATLLETNQLAAEKATISRVLEIYRQGCSRILDDLTCAQEVRLKLYRQQMHSVKAQHAQICEDLIRGLQELDERVQQSSM
ncbi:hypothetical protein NUU61_001077 [Penicillium alfredii]|uniref:Uncharacterized protein n=1 Tax=Penicillium alfredii TaxID=1506179 RepID=A0A9W9KRN6_9EURO|nr:uncharacterized protein NUU61_001077 [Penicillium alfredii]KAJ5115318.1 hypothetical protein NUU61_001077 [Penicillium alfredii]